MVKSCFECLAPAQCGVAVQVVCELIGMGLQQLLQDLPLEVDWGILQLDFRNAFNSVSRAQVLAAARKQCPEAVAWLESCYAAPSSLYCGRARQGSAE